MVSVYAEESVRLFKEWQAAQNQTQVTCPLCSSSFQASYQAQHERSKKHHKGKKKLRWLERLSSGPLEYRREQELWNGDVLQWSDEDDGVSQLTIVFNIIREHV